MSNRNPESTSGTLAELVTFAFEQQAKLLNTMLPGVIHRFDTDTGRAVIQPSLDLLLTDGRRIEPPLISDVPILQPAVAGFHFSLPVDRGDTVWIMCSQRGITEFKKSLARSAPDRGVVMSLSDAVAMPVIFSHENRWVHADDASMSSADGSCRINITRTGNIVASCNGRFTVDALGGIELRGSQHTMEIP